MNTLDNKLEKIIRDSQPIAQSCEEVVVHIKQALEDEKYRIKACDCVLGDGACELHEDTNMESSSSIYTPKTKTNAEEDKGLDPRGNFADVQLIEEMRRLGFELSHHEGIADWFKFDFSSSAQLICDKYLGGVK